MDLNRRNPEIKPRRRTGTLKEAVIGAFCKPAFEVAENLSKFSVRDWNKISFWLDSSGLALYLLDRLTQLELADCLPEPVVAKLRRNLRDNRARMDALLRETAAISRAFHQKDISFVLLKGFALNPESVPDSALRVQVDTDFLIAEDDIQSARQVLNEFGYVLVTAGKDTWEFKAGRPGIPNRKDIYKNRAHRTVELHLLPAGDKNAFPPRQNRLTCAQWRSIQGVPLPTLSPVNLFLDQALHLFKHTCYEQTRAAWVLEFHRHVLAHREDSAFWHELESAAALESQAEIALGVVTLLTTRVFGNFAPEELTRWTVDRLPPAVSLWVEMYGSRTLLTNFPGNKLYLLLRGQLQENRDLDPVSARRILFPFHRPPKKFPRHRDERMLWRIVRYSAQCRYVLLRLRFHLIEGLRYGVEAWRWKRLLARMAE